MESARIINEVQEGSEKIEAVRTNTDTTTAPDPDDTICSCLTQIRGIAMSLDASLESEGVEFVGSGFAIASLAKQAQYAFSKLYGRLCWLEKEYRKSQQSAPKHALSDDERREAGDIIIPRRSDVYDELQAAMGIIRSIVFDDHDPDGMDAVTRAALAQALQLLPGVDLD